MLYLECTFVTIHFYVSEFCMNALTFNKCIHSLDINLSSTRNAISSIQILFRVYLPWKNSKLSRSKTQVIQTKFARFSFSLKNLGFRHVWRISQRGCFLYESLAIKLLAVANRMLLVSCRRMNTCDKLLGSISTRST